MIKHLATQQQHQHHQVMKPAMTLFRGLLRGRGTRCMSSGFKPAPPAPPQLDAKSQSEWEKLQKEAETRGQQVYFHPDVRRKAQPEFEGDRNPSTGESGGPKNDPLRHGDYSYNGRCTDF